MEKNLKIAVVLSAVDKMTRVINTAVDGSVKKLSAFSKKTDELSKRGFELGRSAGAIGLAMAAPLGMAVKAAADYERMNIALKTSFQGNEVAANKAFKTINDFAATTPYQLEEVMTGFIKLKNMGLDPSTKALTAYGNVASGMGKSLNDMVEAVADAATGEFERLKEFGIKASSQGNNVKFTFQGVTTTVKKNSADIEKYLMKIGNTKFAGGIEAQSKSLYGQWSTLTDNVKMLSASFGKILVPALKQVMQSVQPVLERIQKWTEANPKLTQYIVMGAAAVASLTLAVSGLGFMFGGIMKGISLFSSGLSALTSAFGFVSKAVSFLIPIIRTLTAVLYANPILAIVGAIAVAAYLIITNWDKVKGFFVGLWAKIKETFTAGFNWFMNLPFMKPIKQIIDNWDKIKVYFSDLWQNVKDKFNGFIDWVRAIPSKMYDAGVNIVKSIWEGIKSFVNKPIQAIKDMVQKIREYLPFSPAKVGPLRDIHRIKLVETIAESVKPAPLVKAMRVTTAAAMMAATPVMAGAPKASQSANAAKGGGTSVNYSPQITIQGGADAVSFERMLKQHESKIVKVIEEANRKSSRTKF
jgi:hypothetical protein